MREIKFYFLKMMRFFTGTINVLLKEFGIFTQVINLKNRDLEIIVDQSKYRNLNLATKRVIQLIEEVLDYKRNRKCKNCLSDK